MSMEEPAAPDYHDFVIRTLPGLAAIRARPQLWFGCELADSELLDVVLCVAVDAALSGAVSESVRRVRVVIVEDLRFTVEDNGPGLPVHSRAMGLESELVSALSAPGGGGRGGNLPSVMAVCSSVTAHVRTGGRLYRQRVNEDGPMGPPQDLGPADGPGMHLDYCLHAGYLGAAAALPADPGGVLQAFLNRTSAWPGPLGGPLPRTGSEVSLHDLRTGSRSVHIRDN